MIWFSFSRSGNKTKRGVELGHQTRNVLKIEQIMANDVLTLGFLCLSCYITFLLNQLLTATTMVTTISLTIFFTSVVVIELLGFNLLF